MSININSRIDIFLKDKEVHHDDGTFIIIKDGEFYTNWTRFRVNDQGIFLRPASQIPFFKTLEDAVEDLSYYV